jgi:hypothetical protein
LANETGLDDVVHIKHRLTGGLVDDLVNLAAQFGQKREAQILVLEHDGAVSAVRFVPAEEVEHRVWVDVHLVGAAEIRVLHGRPRVSGQSDFTTRGFDRAGNQIPRGEQQYRARDGGNGYPAAKLTS